MSKIIPFDIDLARNGAQVVTADGDPVKIVNFDLKIASASYPILGIITKNSPTSSYEVYEVWPRNGVYSDLDQVGRQDPPPPDLCLVVEDNFADQRDAEATLEIVRNNYTKALAELEASRHNYGRATLRIKELDQVVEKERRERIRLEQWQKDTTEALKKWALVEAWVDRDVCLREIELRGHSTIVIERLKMLKDLEAILKKL